MFAHPTPEPAAGTGRGSLNRALFETATLALRRGGHEVHTIDLYAEGFAPAMSRAERCAYHSDSPVLDPLVARHVELIRDAEMMVFVYPTWWSSTPAILKGWLERTMVPGVGFTFHPRTGKVQPGLTRLRRIVGISTYGSKRWYVRAVNDNGRRMLTRALRMSASWRTRVTWLGLYGLDRTTDDDRAAFLAKVDRTLGALR